MYTREKIYICIQEKYIYIYTNIYIHEKYIKINTIHIVYIYNTYLIWTRDIYIYKHKHKYIYTNIYNTYRIYTRELYIYIQIYTKYSQIVLCPRSNGCIFIANQKNKNINNQTGNCIQGRAGYPVSGTIRQFFSYPDLDNKKVKNNNNIKKMYKSS